MENNLENKHFIFVNFLNKKIHYISNGYFNEYRKLPCPFTIENAKEILPENIINKMISCRLTTIISLTKLCGWSSYTGGPQYLGIIVAPEKYLELQKEEKEIQNQQNENLLQIKSQIPELWKEKLLLEKNINKIRKEIKNYNFQVK